MTAAAFRTRFQEIRRKLETTVGTEVSPAAADAVKALSPAWSANLEAISRDDELSGSISTQPQDVGGGYGSFKYGMFAGGAGTAGSAPPWGRDLRACAFSETLLASAVTNTAQDGAANSITLASGASSTDDIYKGMVVRITSGLASGASNVISAYNGTTKVATVVRAWTVNPDATSVYSIDACALYKPITSGQEALTFNFYKHNANPAANSIISKLIGAMGTASLSVPPRQFAKWMFDMRGQIPANPADVAKPSAASFPSQPAEAFINAEVLIGGTACKLAGFDLNMGGSVDQFDDPSTAYGYDVAAILKRKPTGNLKIATELRSVRDAFADWRSATSRDLVIRWGSAGGKRICIWLPSMRYTGNADEDVRGFIAEGIPFQAHGDDAEAYILAH